MTGSPVVDEDRIRRAAENSLLLLVSRWSGIVLVPLILGVGGWIVSSVQGLQLEVQNVRDVQQAQSLLFESKLQSTDKSMTLRMGAAERRIDRLEYQQDLVQRKITRP